MSTWYADFSWPRQPVIDARQICTRLPARECDFQAGNPVLGNFLSEAITDPIPQVISPFNECIIFATICGRSIFHGQQHHVRYIYGDVSQDCSGQHTWLRNILSRRLRILSEHYDSVADTCDAMILFSNMMAQVTVIVLYKGMNDVMHAIDPGGTLVNEYKQRALSATEQMIKLATALTVLHVFKVRDSIGISNMTERLTMSQIHPLTPIPLLVCVEFVFNNRDSDDSYDSRLKELLDIFRQLRNINDPKTNYTHLLPLSCIAGSDALAEEILGS